MQEDLIKKIANLMSEQAAAFTSLACSGFAIKLGEVFQQFRRDGLGRVARVEHFLMRQLSRAASSGKIGDARQTRARTAGPAMTT